MFFAQNPLPCVRYRLTRRCEIRIQHPRKTNTKPPQTSRQNSHKSNQNSGQTQSKLPIYLVDKSFRQTAQNHRKTVFLGSKPRKTGTKRAFSMNSSRDSSAQPVQKFDKTGSKTGSKTTTNRQTKRRRTCRIDRIHPGKNVQQNLRFLLHIRS